ncbi:MAG TPA: RNA methyltransferase substrate-binding domain-containing protein, partial [Parafilimonas sp.]
MRHKKNRDEEGVFVAEGIKIINELINSNFDIKKIYALKDWIDANTTIKNVIEVSEDELKKISNFETPNKAFAIV